MRTFGDDHDDDEKDDVDPVPQMKFLLFSFFFSLLSHDSSFLMKRVRWDSFAVVGVVSSWRNEKSSIVYCIVCFVG